MNPVIALLHQLPCHQQQVLLWMFLVRENLELKRRIPPLLNLLSGQMTYCDAIVGGLYQLLENRRRGMSYASIGKKLGIDPSKDEVLNIYRAIKEAAPETPDVEKENVTVLKHYPTSLWFLWKSKADIIAKEFAVNLDGILSMGISSRIVSRLGEGASTKLAAFVEVSKMMTEEVRITLTNVDRKTELGKVLAWSNDLQSKVVHSCGTLWSEIGNLLYSKHQMLKHLVVVADVGVDPVKR